MILLTGWISEEGIFKNFFFKEGLYNENHIFKICSFLGISLYLGICNSRNTMMIQLLFIDYKKADFEHPSY